MDERADPISDDWLKSVGFKWAQHDRQPTKHWILWVGGCDGSFQDHEDIGIEVTQMTTRGDAGAYFCWFRSDAAGRYSRFVHVRHMSSKGELIKLVEAVTGIPWKPENHFYGYCRTQKQADIIRQREEQLDRRMRRVNKWHDVEEDDSRCGALPQDIRAQEPRQ